MKSYPYSTLQPEPGILETMTLSEVRDFRPEVLLIPIGSTEPHGPHLPYGTDTYIADGISAEAVRLANKEHSRILRLPPLPISNNVNFKEFPFACRIRVETLMAVLKDLVAFAIEDGVRKIVIINAHGGNDGTIKASLRQLHDDFQQRAFICSCRAAGFDENLSAELFSDQSPHAGESETCLIQHIAPELVVESARTSQSTIRPAFSALPHPAVEWIRPWHLFMPASYAGRPDNATAEKGAKFFNHCAQGMARFLIALSREPWHAAFPYAKEGKHEGH